ncbi:uncharacterized protein BYT42DRAFT_615136 [Radiomyces spectabilis]|uniref:uncharacterized protein n=1 Tax=Radiomyces spectabilis TaxID=64574 RepID=UPI00221EC32D|nr:uncharacterized protein BYT42DRAFT_615136 [Radiomyces spectabilis]KAI8376383.1 hypothetical protein BYT42DRAFT_615136 [Radiomyces spectabilis]
MASRRQTPTPTPSHSTYSFQSALHHTTDDSFLNSKEECRSKAEKTLNDWTEALKFITRYTDSHDDVRKAARSFVQVDNYAANTQLALKKTGKLLDALIDRKFGMLATTKTLNEIHSLLETEPMTRTYWRLQSPHTPATNDEPSAFSLLQQQQQQDTP